MNERARELLASVWSHSPELVRNSTSVTPCDENLPCDVVDGSRALNAMIDLGRIQRNMDAVSEYARIRPEGVPRRARYFGALNRLQKHRIPCSVDAGEPIVEFEFGCYRGLLDSLACSDEMQPPPDITPFPKGEWPRIRERFCASLQMLDDYDTDVAAACRNLLAVVLFLRTDGFDGGSFWHGLGCVWFNPTEAWTPIDFAAHLLHESVHQAMFLDDMVNSLFSVSPCELASDAAHVTSSILCVPRPYDFAFHAATVSVALIQFFERAGCRRQSETLCLPLLATLVELADKCHLLSVRGREILCDMLAAVNQSEAFRVVTGQAAT